MNNSTSTYPDFPVQMKWHFLVFLTFMSIGGAVGNAVVLFIYQFRMKQTVGGLLIQMLAVVDLGTVLIVIPASVAHIFIPSTEVCKWLVFVSMAIAAQSGLLLSVIAFQRYRKICHPHQKQRITRFVAKIAFIFCGCASVCVSIPTLFTVSSKSAFLTSNPTFAYPTCTFTETNYFTSTYDVISHLAIVVISLFITAMYVCLGRTLIRHKMKMNKNASLRSDCERTGMLLCVTLMYFVAMALFGFSIRRTEPVLMQDYFLVASALYIPSINCIVNPVSYFLISTEFRSRFMALCCNRTGQQISPTELAKTSPGKRTESGNL